MCIYRAHLASKTLSPTHTSNNAEATLSNATSQTILWTKSNVAVFGNKVECCFDVIAGVDGALQWLKETMTDLYVIVGFASCGRGLSFLPIVFSLFSL